MANLKEIRGRITTVKNTRKITSAMSRIASARLARAQGALNRARRYGSRMEEVVGELVAGLDEHVEHPLLTSRPGNRVALVVVSADRGLCGGFNTQIGKAARKFVTARRDQGDEVYLIGVGRKAFDYLRSLGINHDRLIAAPDTKTVVEQANELSTELLANFEGEATESEGGQFDEIHLLYNHFINVLTQEPTTKQLLPVPPVEPAEKEGMSLERSFEPDVDTLLNHLLPVAVRTAVQQAFFHSAAAELAARRTAMDAATDNASNLISDLTLEYNRERQAAITTELAEIVGGAEALKG